MSAKYYAIMHYDGSFRIQMCNLTLRETQIKLVSLKSFRAKFAPEALPTDRPTLSSRIYVIPTCAAVVTWRDLTNSASSVKLLNL